MRSPLLVVIALAAGTALAHADATAADELARAAETLAASGDYPGAAAKYREAYRQHPRPDLMCNVGVAYYKAKDLPRAHRYLDQCLTTGASLDREFIGNVKMVLTAVEQKLITGDYKPLNFIVEPQSATTTFSSGVHDEPLVGPRQIWVPFGHYQVTIHAEGFADRILDITAANRDRDDHSVKLEPSAAIKPALPDPPAETRLPDAPPPVAPAERSYVAPIIASAATGVAGGLALGFFLAARNSASVANDESSNIRTYGAAVEEVESHQRVSWIVGGVAGVAAITAGVLWYRALKKPAPVEVGASRGGASVSIIGRW